MHINRQTSALTCREAAPFNKAVERMAAGGRLSQAHLPGAAAIAHFFR